MDHRTPFNDPPHRPRIRDRGGRASVVSLSDRARAVRVPATTARTRRHLPRTFRRPSREHAQLPRRIAATALRAGDLAVGAERHQLLKRPATLTALILVDRHFSAPEPLAFHFQSTRSRRLKYRQPQVPPQHGPSRSRAPCRRNHSRGFILDFSQRPSPCARLPQPFQAELISDAEIEHRLKRREVPNVNILVQLAVKGIQTLSQ